MKKSIVRNYNTFKGLSAYQSSLLHPELKTSKTRVPGTFGSQTIAYHRNLVVTAQVNVNGNFCLVVPHNEILDSAAVAGSTYLTNAAAGYDPGIAPVAVASTPLDIRGLYNLTTLTVKTCRLVSGAVAVTSLSPALNRTGTITCCRLTETGDYIGPGPWGISSALLMPTLSTISSFTKKEFSVANGFGPLMCWLPSDMEDFQLEQINLAYMTRHGQKENVNWTVIIGQGLQSNSLIRIEFWANFEVTPTTNGSLTGLESPGPFIKSVPCLEAEYIAKNPAYSRYLMRSFMASDQGDALPVAVKQQMKKKRMVDDFDDVQAFDKKQLMYEAIDALPVIGNFSKAAKLAAKTYNYITNNQAKAYSKGAGKPYVDIKHQKSKKNNNNNKPKKNGKIKTN